jgi:DNA-binding MarR family transcriptional regulator
MTLTSDSPPPPTSSLPSLATGDVVDALTEWLSLIKEGLKEAMREWALPTPYVHALAKIDGAVSMKEIGIRLGCDPSFVTAIADLLESRGLARRQVDHLDRRVKNLVLTPEGERARAVLQRDFYDNFPGIRRLSSDERREFIALLRKMVDAELTAGTAPGTPLCSPAV